MSYYSTVNKIKTTNSKEIKIMKKNYKIEIDCANCAIKVEDAAKKVEGVKDCTVSFMTQKMKVEFEEGADVDTVMKAVVKAAKNVESDFEIEL